MKLTYFSADEFKCKCNRTECNAAPIDPFLLIKLDQARRALGMPIHINSGSRCDFWNKHVGGSKNSQHLKGLAADIAIPSANYGYKLLFILLKLEFSGIGIKDGMIHCDVRNGLPVLFGYS